MFPIQSVLELNLYENRNLKYLHRTLNFICDCNFSDKINTGTITLTVSLSPLGFYCNITLIPVCSFCEIFSPILPPSTTTHI